MSNCWEKSCFYHLLSYLSRPSCNQVLAILLKPLSDLWFIHFLKKRKETKNVSEDIYIYIYKVSLTEKAVYKVYSTKENYEV